MVAGPSLIRLLVHYWCVCWSQVCLSLVRHWSLTGLSVRVVVTGLFVRRWSVVGLLLVRLFVSRLQLVCCSSNADLSARVMVASPAALFAPRPSDRPSLLCLFVRRLSGTSPSLVRVVDPSLVFLLESSLSYRCLVARPLGSTGHCVRFGSAVQFYTPRGTAVRFYTPRGTAVRFYTPRGTVPFDSPCAHSYSLCWLSLAATLFTHTLSHAWCPVTLLSLTRCSTVVVLRASLGFVASRLLCHACFVMKGVSTWVENGT